MLRAVFQHVTKTSCLRARLSLRRLTDDVQQLLLGFGDGLNSVLKRSSGCFDWSSSNARLLFESVNSRLGLRCRKLNCSLLQCTSAFYGLLPQPGHTASCFVYRI